MRYLITQNGHIHDETDDHAVALFSCAELAKLTKQEAHIAEVKITINDAGRQTETLR